MVSSLCLHFLLKPHKRLLRKKPSFRSPSTAGNGCPRSGWPEPRWLGWVVGSIPRGHRGTAGPPPVSLPGECSRIDEKGCGVLSRSDGPLTVTLSPVQCLPGICSTECVQQAPAPWHWPLLLRLIPQLCETDVLLWRWAAGH